MEVAVRVSCGNHWIDLRDIEQLTWADQETFEAPANEVVATARRAEYDPETGERRTVLSEDGKTRVPLKVPALITADLLIRRRDAVLGSLITDASYVQQGIVTLPFTPEWKTKIGRDMAAKLTTAIEPYLEALSGPKETPTPASGSDSSSKDRPETSPQD
jgi:hypothetical protein